MAEDLTLYYFPTCPYCRRVLGALESLDVQVELRNVRAEPAFREELSAARGRTSVPVLRISGEGGDRWLPESRDIVAYLMERFGGGET